MLCIIGNPQTLQGYTIKNVSDELILAHTQAGSEFFVEYDPKNPSHVAFKPGDIHDGKGNFAPPPLTPDLVAMAKAVINESTLSVGDKTTAIAMCDTAQTVDQLPVNVAGNRDWKPAPEEFEKAAAEVAVALE